ncbi:MAG: GNAT family N-acetyltransferase [Clostridiales bacterium]|nr:GNAT family N-acetyltransferase [Clostridiales bacterium]
MEKIEIFNASLKEAVFTFTDACFRSVGKEFEPDGRHADYNDIKKNFDRFWCLVSEDKVLGTVAVKRLDETTSELKALYLSPELRGKGYGYKMLDLAVLFAREKGYRRIVLDSMSKYTSALKLYEKYGFTHIERYNGNQKADVFMEYRFTGRED